MRENNVIGLSEAALVGWYLLVNSNRIRMGGVGCRRRRKVRGRGDV